MPDDVGFGDICRMKMCLYFYASGYTVALKLCIYS